MGIFSFIARFFAKKDKILKPEDLAEIRMIQNNAYMEEARKLVIEKAKDMAKTDFEIKKKSEWDLS